ncbi:Concanavalin A-like lectin/glucanases superfamily [uncultured Caudovirales phage]|uniref:Concanavalin A-like lectin/glucanases superfamily n=1 Tax=uncultured Caudovirales phage TaxID=2100421 RepID=A0A6J7WB59_9CAUD|nr:Concanavalin A-like lectin/glucanases superfamily [uncultured Caudovirales phage]
MPIVNPITFYGLGSSGGGSSAPTPTVYWEADYGIVTTTNGTTADASPVSGNKVLSWTSKDASATVASYGTNANRPTYIVPTYGNPYVTFDGSLNQRLETTAWNSTFNGAAAYTMGVYFRKPPVYSGYRNESFMSLNNTGNSGTLQAGPSGAGVSIFSGGVTYMGGTRVILSYGTELVGTTSFFGSFSTTSTSAAASSITKLYFDGVLVASDTTSNATVNYTNVITLGGTFDTSTSKTKDCYGFYLFNTQLSDANVLAVHNAAATRMNIGDKYAANNSLLLHFDGANGSTTFTDSSPNALTVTASNTTISTTGAMTGFGQCGLFSGSSSYITGSHSTLSLGRNNFTVECWLYFDLVATGQQPFSIYFGSSLCLAFYTSNTSGTGKLNYYLSSTGSGWDVASGVLMGNITAGTWIHCALVRNGSTFTPYINGVAGTTTTSSATLYAQTTFYAGISPGLSSGQFSGKIDDIRVTNGVARTITMPTGPFPNT